MGCSGDCSSCSSSCEKKDLHVPCNEYSDVKKVIGVVSGKGGVGKSMTASMLAHNGNAGQGQRLRNS